jgi:hypothetical protein
MTIQSPNSPRRKSVSATQQHTIANPPQRNSSIGVPVIAACPLGAQPWIAVVHGNPTASSRQVAAGSNLRVFCQLPVASCQLI